MNPSQKAQLRSLARRGNDVAQALMDGVGDVVVVVGTEASNAIALDIRVGDNAKHVTAKVYGVAATLTDNGLGTIASGSGTGEIWAKPGTAGQLQLLASFATAGSCLVKLETDTGDTAMVELTFA